MLIEPQNYIHFTDTKQLRNFPCGGNFVAFSQLKQFEAPMTRRDVVGLKYVIQGEENYVINGSRHRVKAGQILVVDEMEKGEAFNSFNGSDTIGLCINIDKQLMNEVLVSRLSPTFSLDIPTRSENFNFLLQPTPASQIGLGKAVQTMASEISRQPGSFSGFTNDFFHSLAESLLQSHVQANSLTQKVQASKKITQQEIYKRLLFAKEIMDDSAQAVEVSELAAIAGLSEYHFSRVFKSVFSFSPYKYQMNVRLQKAAQLLRDGHHSITETAYNCGFSDIHSFSKAFKKQFSVSPSAFSRN